MAISFSIIIPVYNKGKYIAACIDSILKQSYRDFEVIVVNDGSQDNSLEILNTYNDSRIRIFSFKNHGVSTARNIGIANSRNEYITFVDADDYLQYNYLELFATDIETSDCDVLIGGLTKYTPDGNKRIVRCSLKTGAVPLNHFKRNYVNEVAEHEGIFGYVAAKFVKRELLNRYDLRFRKELKLAEDLDFWSNVYLHTDRISISEHSGYMYRQEVENSGINTTGQHISQIGIWYNILKNYATDPLSGNQIAFKRINGYVEAYCLDLPKPIYSTIRKYKNQISHQLEDIKPSLKTNTSSILQNLFWNYPLPCAYLYLNLRYIYHKLRSCLK